MVSAKLAFLKPVFGIAVVPDLVAPSEVAHTVNGPIALGRESRIAVANRPDHGNPVQKLVGHLANFVLAKPQNMPDLKTSGPQGALGNRQYKSQSQSRGRSRRSRCALNRFISSSSASMSSVRRSFLDFGLSAARSFSSAFSTESFGISAMVHRPHIQSTSVQTIANSPAATRHQTVSKIYLRAASPFVEGIATVSAVTAAGHPDSFVDLDQHELRSGELYTPNVRLCGQLSPQRETGGRHAPWSHALLPFGRSALDR